MGTKSGTYDTGIPQSLGADARQRRAEELRREFTRLNEETERDCEFLEAEGAARRQRFDAEKNAWQNRVNAAAEELRSNFAQWSPFDLPHRPRPPPTPREPGKPAPPPSVRRRVVPSTLNTKAFDNHEAAWTRLEASLETSSSPTHFSDIPWPLAGAIGGITGVMPGDSASVAKRKLVAALRRWHPDKWRRILDRVPEAEQARVMEQVKIIAQRLLDEKAKLTGPGGVLH